MIRTQPLIKISVEEYELYYFERKKRNKRSHSRKVDDKMRFKLVEDSEIDKYEKIRL